MATAEERIPLGPAVDALSAQLAAANDERAERAEELRFQQDLDQDLERRLATQQRALANARFRASRLAALEEIQLIRERILRRGRTVERIEGQPLQVSGVSRTVSTVADALSDAEDVVQELTDRRQDAIVGRIRALRREGREVVVRIRAAGLDIIRPVDYIIEQRYINEVQQSGSDQETVLALSDPNADIALVPAQRSAQQVRVGGFFRYYVNDEIAQELSEQGIDLRKHCIYTESQWMSLKPHERNLGCIWTALTNAGMNMLEAVGVQDMEMTATKDLKKLAELTKSQIVLSTDKSTRRYGSKKDPEVRLTLINEHYAHNETFEQKVSIRKMIETTDPEQRKKSNANLRSKKSYIHLHEVIKLLEKHGHLRPMPDEHAFLLPVSERRIDPMTARGYVPTPTEINEPKRRWDPRDAESTKRFRDIWYADFETTTDGECHQPYLACAVDKTLKKKVHALAGSMPTMVGWRLLKEICDDSNKPQDEKDPILIYFHNLAYDSRFLLRFLRQPKLLESDGRVYSITGTFQNIPIEVHDTYAHISTKLDLFQDMFKLDVGKQKAFCYDAFTTKTVVNIKSCSLEPEIKKKIPACYHLPNGNVNLQQYGLDYCYQDVETQAKGFNQHAENVLEHFGLDIHTILTTASFAHRYMFSQGVYDGVEYATADVRDYLQHAVIGGRVMTANNQAQSHEGKFSYFDMTSLYPSAMRVMDGFPMGKPKRFEGNPPAEFTTYVATVTVKKVGKRLRFPTLSIIDENGGRHWTNDLEGQRMILNNISIEDAQRFQGIEFEFEGGLYWNEGWNKEVNDVIQRLFDTRKRYKSEGNPVEQCYKLIMNSSYGKTIERPHDERLELRRMAKDEAIKRLVGYGSGFISGEQVTEEWEGRALWKLRHKVADYSHESFPHVGGLILSWSKRLMFEMMVPLDDHIYYTDTDSMIIDFDALEKVPAEKKGGNLGQFHNDFKMRTMTKGAEVYADYIICLAKKVYACRMATDEGDLGYHIRIKGVPEQAVLHYLKVNDITPMAMANRLTVDKIRFDLLAGGERVSFKLRAGTVSNVDTFWRELGPYPLLARNTVSSTTRKFQIDWARLH